MATCGGCGGLGGRVTLGGWIQCDSCGGSGTEDDDETGQENSQ